MTAKCSCGQPIIWARDAVTGRLTPVDRDSAGDMHGDLAISHRDQDLVCRGLSGAGQLQPGEKRGLCHWTTCIGKTKNR
ncbi:MAG: hypothetical protein M0030_11545 [Actinomycetota bacterium]|nr:hypothetical protein [Actinomycetota bacterium]